MAIDYVKISDEMKEAWFIYKATNPFGSISLRSFIAGWNAARGIQSEVKSGL